MSTSHPDPGKSETTLQRLALLLFLRYPTAGRVKTRLAATIGADAACALYRSMAEQTMATAALLPRPWTPVVMGAGANREAFRQWLGRDKTVRLQQGNGLGERLSAAFVWAFSAGFDAAAAIGGDCPDLAPRHYTRTLHLLMRRPVVLGPALDGGYVLVGCRATTPLSILFANMPWSTDRVLAETESRLQRQGLGYGLLEPLRDVDREQDARELGLL